jgi:hypothetical protein
MPPKPVFEKPMIWDLNTAAASGSGTILLSSLEIEPIRVTPRITNRLEFAGSNHFLRGLQAQGSLVTA